MPGSDSVVLAILDISASRPDVASRQAGLMAVTWSLSNASRATSRSSTGMRASSTWCPSPRMASAATTFATTFATTCASTAPKPGPTIQPAWRSRPGAAPGPYRRSCRVEASG
ncbi:hypothetical protein MMR14E_22300 [Methylobacterium mesophilicum]